MEYRVLGKTGLEVSVLAFGGSSLGSVFRQVREADGLRALRVAVANGVNLIDTSPFYGLTKAETVLGKALAEIPRDSYYLATKVGRYGYEVADCDFSAERVAKSVDSSLTRLGVDYVDFIQVHDIEFGDVDRIVEETLPALRKVQEQGKVRFVGVTGLPIRLLREVMARVEIDVIQSYCHYCLNDTSLADLPPELKEKGVGVLSSAPLAMRLLTLTGPPHWHPAPEAVREKCMAAARHCSDKGADISSLALRFAVANPDIHSTIVGTANPDRVLANLRAIEEPMDEDLLKEILAILKPIHNVTWTQGRPENS